MNWENKDRWNYDIGCSSIKMDKGFTTIDYLIEWKKPIESIKIDCIVLKKRDVQIFKREFRVL